MVILDDGGSFQSVFRRVQSEANLLMFLSMLQS